MVLRLRLRRALSASAARLPHACLVCALLGIEQLPVRLGQQRLREAQLVLETTLGRHSRVEGFLQLVLAAHTSRQRRLTRRRRAYQRRTRRGWGRVGRRGGSWRGFGRGVNHQPLRQGPRAHPQDQVVHLLESHQHGLGADLGSPRGVLARALERVERLVELAHSCVVDRLEQQLPFIRTVVVAVEHVGHVHHVRALLENGWRRRPWLHWLSFNVHVV